MFVMTIPNFFILGAAKSGTTSLQAYLKQHPDIFFSKNKEPNFFAFENREIPEKGAVAPKLLYKLIYSNSVTEWDDYITQFALWAEQKAVGEASVRYLYYPDAAENINKRIKSPKFIVMLRDPTTRLLSHYRMNKQLGIEPLDLIPAIEAEGYRLANQWGWDWHYVSIGNYTEQLTRYFDLFKRESFKICFYDDFLEEPTSVIQEICDFLEVNSDFSPCMQSRGKVPYYPRSLIIDRWLNRRSKSRNVFERKWLKPLFTPIAKGINKINQTPPVKFTQDEIEYTKNLFSDENRKLEDLLNVSLPWNC